MKRYFEHMHSKDPHERRQHAMQVAGVLTAAVFVVWVTTLGMRLGSGTPVVVSEGQTQTSLPAAAAAAREDNSPHLEVSTTSIYSNSGY